MPRKFNQEGLDAYLDAVERTATLAHLCEQLSHARSDEAKKERAESKAATATLLPAYQKAVKGLARDIRVAAENGVPPEKLKAWKLPDEALHDLTIALKA